MEKEIVYFLILCNVTISTPRSPNTRPVSRRVTFRHQTLVLFGAFMFQMSTVLRGGLRAEHRLCQDPSHSSMAVTLRSLHHLGTCFTSHGQGVEKILQTLPAVEVFQGWTKGSAGGGKVIKSPGRPNQRRVLTLELSSHGAAVLLRILRCISVLFPVTVRSAVSLHHSSLFLENSSLKMT